MTAAIAAVLMLLSAPAYSAPECRPGQSFNAVDISYQVNDRFLKNIKSIGVSTVIRYYDWTNETLPGKTLTKAELALIRQNALNVAVVFQHNNDSMRTFETANRGTIDANRSLDLAREFQQPSDSAIYFGVDGVDDKFVGEFRSGRRGADDKYGLKLIKAYFDGVNSAFRERGSRYSIGVYGSGLVCREMLTAGVAKRCWLANATSWPEYEAFERTNRWSLKQSLPTKRCFGEEVDLNVVNPRSSDFGQWRP
jgi:hypothetical protein